jgi:hypothetical protein
MQGATGNAAPPPMERSEPIEKIERAVVCWGGSLARYHSYASVCVPERRLHVCVACVFSLPADAVRPTDLCGLTAALIFSRCGKGEGVGETATEME